MGLLFILVGIGLIAIHFYSQSKSPEPPVSKYLNGGAGVVSLLFGVYLFVNVQNAWETQGAWIGFCYLVGTFAAIGAGGYLLHLASHADEKAAADMAFRAQKKDDETRHERNQIELENARLKSEKDADLEDERRKTEAAGMRNRRIELNVRNTLAETAEEQGLDVNSVIGINAQKYSAEIELENYAKTQVIDLQIRKEEKLLEIQTEAELIRQQMEAADRVEHYDIIDNLDEKYKNLLKERRDIELNEKDEWLKERNLARLDKRISQLEADIDGRQNRLLSSADRKEIKRLG